MIFVETFFKERDKIALFTGFIAKDSIDACVISTTRLWLRQMRMISFPDGTGTVYIPAARKN